MWEACSNYPRLSIPYANPVPRVVQQQLPVVVQQAPIAPAPTAIQTSPDEGAPAPQVATPLPPPPASPGNTASSTTAAVDNLAGATQSPRRVDARSKLPHRHCGFSLSCCMVKKKGRASCSAILSRAVATRSCDANNFLHSPHESLHGYPVPYERPSLSPIGRTVDVGPEFANPRGQHTPDKYRWLFLILRR